jgi:ubiquinone/menaquinone biosynthesis C-methylase UbiE
MIKLWWRLVRFGFRLLYNEMAFTYDLVSKVVSLGEWRCWQRGGLKHINVQRGSLVLELAHGTGDLQLDLSSTGYRTIGYDLSPYMGRITQRKLTKHNIKAKLSRGKAQTLPFKDNLFDAVICTFPTPFVFEQETLREVHRVLKPNGRFVIVINGVLTGGGAVKQFLEWLYRITGQRADAESNEHQFDEMSAFFKTAGFETEFVREFCRRSYAQIIVASDAEFTPR